MKNLDGSQFKVTPEQFIQQRSNNFKKYFNNSEITDYDNNPLIVHNSSFEKFSQFIPDKSKVGKDFYFTPVLDKSKQY